MYLRHKCSWFYFINCCNNNFNELKAKFNFSENPYNIACWTYMMIWCVFGFTCSYISVRLVVFVLTFRKKDLGILLNNQRAKSHFPLIFKWLFFDCIYIDVTEEDTKGEISIIISKKTTSPMNRRTLVPKLLILNNTS